MPNETKRVERQAKAGDTGPSLLTFTGRIVQTPSSRKKEGLGNSFDWAPVGRYMAANLRWFSSPLRVVWPVKHPAVAVSFMLSAVATLHFRGATNRFSHYIQSRCSGSQNPISDFQFNFVFSSVVGRNSEVEGEWL